MNTKSLSLLLLSLLVSCQMAPEYHPPKIDVPNEWHAQIPMENTCDSVDCLAWWQTFKDPILDELIFCAWQNNPNLEIAWNRILESRQLQKRAFADLFPVLSAYPNYNHQFSTKQGLVSSFGGLAIPAATLQTIGLQRQVDFYQIEFDAKWELDIFGAIRSENKACKADLQASFENRRDILLSLLADVAKNYLTLRCVQQQIAITTKNIEVQQKRIYLQSDLARSGINNDLDVSMSDAEEASLKSQIHSLQILADEAIHHLSVLLGLWPGELFDLLTSEGCHFPPPPSLGSVGIPSDLLRRRPDIRKAEREIAAANARLGVAIADLFPKFKIEAGVGDLSTIFNMLTSGANNFWYLHPECFIPIFNADKLMANVRANRVRTQTAVLNFEKVVLGALEEVENAFSGYLNHVKRVKDLESKLKANQNVLLLTLDLYENGINDYLSVTLAQKGLYEAEDTLVQAQLEVALNYVKLYKVLGGGWDLEFFE